MSHKKQNFEKEKKYTNTIEYTSKQTKQTQHALSNSKLVLFSSGYFQLVALLRHQKMSAHQKEKHNAPSSKPTNKINKQTTPSDGPDTPSPRRSSQSPLAKPQHPQDHNPP